MLDPGRSLHSVQKLTNVPNDVIRVVRLPQEPTARRQFFSCKAGLSRRHQQHNPWPVAVNVVRQFQAIHRPWHVDVREQRPYVIALIA
jgi:hypothetical protein